PNPANDVLNISFNDNTSRLFILSIIDQTGRMITTEKWNCYAGKNNLSINTGRFAEGVYQLKTECNGGTAIKRFVIAR
ncbi:MAG: T9SS type A sorting domain-containing protein, partial [Crocinitomicaceae bacterium]|nr:T9SS type A sorting domain-containing protein [Crocinitomicaceae bacterium]